MKAQSVLSGAPGHNQHTDVLSGNPLFGSSRPVTGHVSVVQMAVCGSHLDASSRSDHPLVRRGLVFVCGILFRALYEGRSTGRRARR